MSRTPKKRSLNSNKWPRFVVFLLVGMLGVGLVFNYLIKPSYATCVEIQEVDVESDPSIKRTIETTTNLGLVSMVEIPKTQNVAINESLTTFVKEHQKSFYEVSSKLSNRLQQKGKASHRILFDWNVVAPGVANVVFYEHWSTDNVAHRFDVETFLIDFNESRVIKSSDLIDFSKADQERLSRKISTKIKRKGLAYSPDASFDETIHNFLSNPLVLIERDAIKLMFKSPNLKNNDGGFSTIALPFSSVPSIMSPTLLQLLPIRENQTKRVAFTFDDGPNIHTTKVLEILKKYDAQATFFVLGLQVAKYPELTKQIIVDGHELGNHSYNHKDLVKANPAVARAELENVNKLVYETSGASMKLFRPPYGRYNKKVMALTDLQVTMWTIDPLDWKVKVVESIVKNIMKDVKNGSIILMHDIYPTSAEALEEVLKQLSMEDYEFVGVSDLLEPKE
jgi:peptidoglycan/xylan/chitin deacetylase (PgdA/CDA1 family)